MFWVNVRSTGEEFRRRIFSGFGGILDFLQQPRTTVQNSGIVRFRFRFRFRFRSRFTSLEVYHSIRTSVDWEE